MRKNSKTKRTEAALSIIVTSALVITLAIVVGSAIKKGTNNEENNNYVNLNETESKTTLTADNSNNSNKNTTIKTETESKSTPSQDTRKSTERITIEETKEAPVETKPQTAANETIDTNTPGDVPVISPTAVSSGYSFSEADTLMMPVNGDIILAYSMDNTIFFPTLNVYKCNPGMYIGAQAGTQVMASASGKVSSITSNEELGNIVTMDLGNGYEATYGQLSSVNVKEGEFVLAGTSIGSIDQPTIYYSVEGSGVYFSLTHDGVPENPLDYME